MKVTKSKIMQVVKEELNTIVKEAGEEGGGLEDKLATTAGKRTARATAEVDQAAEIIDWLKVAKQAFATDAMHRFFHILGREAGWSSDEITMMRKVISKIRQNAADREEYGGELSPSSTRHDGYADVSGAQSGGGPMTAKDRNPALKGIPGLNESKKKRHKKK